MSDSFNAAKENYAQLGVDVDNALKQLKATAISLHCWQGDDVGGFEADESDLSGGIAVTGNYPGRASNIDELRQDMEQVFSLIPGKHRINLHAIYADFQGKRVDRDAVSVEHFASWIEWCKANRLGFDFNPTNFAHPKAADGFTLAHPDKAIRDFWIEHGKRCREIAAAAGKELNNPVVTNFWMPDGHKDMPADRLGARRRMKESLDAIFAHSVDAQWNKDAVECKLFGIGSESFVVGSHEFYLGYASQKNMLLCLDAGHFHPTETIADKISSCLLYVPELLLHVSRGVRWDSDHVVLFDDATRSIIEEVVRCDALDRVNIGLDFFDASINRIGAWAIGSRATLKSLLWALLEPRAKLVELEEAQDYTSRLALFESLKTMPFGAIWNAYCEQEGVPTDAALINEVKAYESKVLSKRSV